MLQPGALPFVMGIVNVTPDSFSDGGRFVELEAAVAHALALLRDGADVLDIGGESTRPGADRIGADEEIARVVPLIRALRAQTDAVISVDTYKAAVAAAAIDAGADIINDISGFRFDDAMSTTAAATGVGVILMHSPPTVDAMHDVEPDVDIVARVRGVLLDAVAQTINAGVARERVAVDPGFGFGKSAEQNYRLFGALGQLVDDGFPVLVGVSRKRMIRGVVGEDPRLVEHGGAIASVLAAQAGASILRVHDVAATVAALRTAGELLRYRQPEV